MSERHRFPVLVHLLAFSSDRLLLLRRAGTGVFDGCWAPPGGHMEPGETPRAAAVRETWEEVGLEFDCDQLQAVGLMHYASNGGGFNLLFAASLPELLRPSFDRCSADAADWWPHAALPEKRVPWLDAALESPGLPGLDEAMGRLRKDGRHPDGARWYVEGH